MNGLDCIHLASRNMTDLFPRIESKCHLKLLLCASRGGNNNPKRPITTLRVSLLSWTPTRASPDWQNKMKKYQCISLFLVCVCHASCRVTERQICLGVIAIIPVERTVFGQNALVPGLTRLCIVQPNLLTYHFIYPITMSNTQTAAHPPKIFIHFLPAWKIQITRPQPYAGSHKLWDGMDLDGGLPSGYRLGYWCEVTREARRLVIIRAGVD